MRLATTIFALTCLLIFGVAAPGSATPISLNAIDSGWYDQTGDHDPANENYIAGQAGAFQFRNFFVFDLSGLTGQTITSAVLATFNPVGGYSSPDPTETYQLFDVATPVNTLRAGGTGLTGIFADLGSGTSFGASTVSLASNNMTVLTTLNAAGVAALNNSIGVQFAVGGALTTLAGSSDQFVFGFTPVTGGLRQLQLEVTPNTTVVPEPASLVLVGTGLVAAGMRRRRKTKQTDAERNLP